MRVKNKQFNIKYIMILIIGFFLLFLVSCEEEKEPEVEYYNVTYNIDGIETKEEVLKGSTISLPKTPLKKGYEFTGWFNENTYFDFVNEVVNSDITLTAKWTKKQYTLTIQCNNGKAEIVKDFYYEDEIKFEGLDNLTRTGYTFDGWSEEFPKTMPANDLTIYANWKRNSYHLTIKYENGNDDVVLSFLYGQEIQIDYDYLKCSKEGYSFKDWSIELPETMPANDIEMVASWEEIKKVEVRYVYKDGVTNDKVFSLETGDAIPKVKNPSRTGYQFKGWNNEIPEYIANENMVFEATWERLKFTVTIHNYYNGNIDYQASFEYGANISIINPTQAGFQFKGYYKNPLDETTKTSFSKMGLSDIEVTALWDIKTYTINYHCSETTQVEDLVTTYTVLMGDFELNNPVQEGYCFRGWYLEKTLINKITSIEMKNLRNYELYPKWDKIIDSPRTLSHLVYNGENQSPVWIGLEEGINVTGDYKDIKIPGTYEAVFKLQAGYCWFDGSTKDISIEWTIHKREITLEWSNTNVVYNETYQSPNVNVIKDNGTSKSIVELHSSYINSGTYTVEIDTVNGDTKEALKYYIIHNPSTKFTIEKAVIDHYELIKNTFVYNGSAPDVKVGKVYSGSMEAQMYSVSGDFSGVNVGTYEFTITGMLNWKGSITASYEIVKADSPIVKNSYEITVTPKDTLDFTDLVSNSVGELTATINNSGLYKPSTIEGNCITIGTLKDNFPVFTTITLTDSGDENHNPKSVTINLNVAKKYTKSVVAEEYYYLSVFDTVSVHDLGITFTPAIENPAYYFCLVNSVDYLVVNQNDFTISGQYGSEDSYAIIRYQRESNETTIGASADIKVKVIKESGLADLHMNCVPSLAKTISIVNPYPSNHYELAYDWYYLSDSNEKTTVSTTPTFQALTNTDEGKVLGCKVTITGEFVSRQYDCYEYTVPEQKIEYFKYLKIKNTDNVYLHLYDNNYANISYRPVYDYSTERLVELTLYFDISEETGNPLVKLDKEMTERFSRTYGPDNDGEDNKWWYLMNANKSQYDNNKVYQKLYQVFTYYPETGSLQLSYDEYIYDELQTQQSEYWGESNTTETLIFLGVDGEYYVARIITCKVKSY